MSTKRIPIIALFGKSGSGKDTLQSALCSDKNYNYHKIVSATTRPPRDYEQEGVDYYFLTEIEFAQKIIDLEMLEATSFRDWFYGTPLSSLDPDKINIGVFNPQGIRCLLDDDRLDVIPVYVLASDKTRMLRALNREDQPDVSEIARRYLKDNEDFSGVEDEFDYYCFYNEEECTDDVLTHRFFNDVVCVVLLSQVWEGQKWLNI